MINNFLADIASTAMQMEKGDYIQGGLLICGKCNTPREHIIFTGGEEFKVPCLCKCRTEARGAEQAERALEARQRYINRLREIGFPDAEMSEWTFEHDDWNNEKISTVARRYVDNWSEMLKRGKGLLFYGSVGSGKTFISACIANALIDQTIPCLVTNFARVTNQIMNAKDKQNYIDDLAKFKLVVIDDLASERDTEYMGEIIQSVIDARYRSKLPLIVTTNLTAEELKNPADMKRQRIYSRLFEMCIPVEVKGQDRRKVKLAKDYKDLEEMLGL